MKILKTATYVKRSRFEGEYYSVDKEDVMVDDVLKDEKRKRELGYRSPSIPGAYKAKRPYSTLVDRGRYRSLQDLGSQRGYVEDESDTLRRIQRINKAKERDERLNIDRRDFYNDLTEDELIAISEEVKKYEMRNPGRTITDSMLRFMLRKIKNNLKRKEDYIDFIDRGLEQGCYPEKTRIAYTIVDDKENFLDDNVKEKELDVSTILDFLCFLNDKIDEFSNEKEIDPNKIRDFLDI